MPAYRNRTTVVTATGGSGNHHQQQQQHQTTTRQVVVVNGKSLKEPSEQGNRTATVRSAGAARSGGSGAGLSGSSALGNVIVKNGKEPTGGNGLVLLNSVSVISGGPAGSSGVLEGSSKLDGASGRKADSVGSVSFTLANGQSTVGSNGAGIVQRKDDTSGPVSPTEGCVAPIYYTNISENKSGKSRGARFALPSPTLPFLMHKASSGFCPSLAGTCFICPSWKINCQDEMKH